MASKRRKIDNAPGVTTTSLDPICRIEPTDPEPHTLILGTHPSVKSFAQGEELTPREIQLRGGSGPQNYGHIRNCFWNIMGSGCAFRRDVLPYEKQKASVTQRGFAVWDVVRECARSGSLDSNISADIPNNIPGFVADHTCINRLVFAATAANFFRKKQHFLSWLNSGIASNCNFSVDFVIRKDAPSFSATKKLFGSYKAVREISSIDCGSTTDSSHGAESQVISHHFGVSGTRGRSRQKTNIVKSSHSEVSGQHRQIELVVLPSTSPAAATLRPAVKEKQWLQGCFGLTNPPAHYRCPGCKNNKHKGMARHFFAECPEYDQWRRSRPKINQLIQKGSMVEDGLGWYL